MTDLLAAGELLPLSSDWFRALAETTSTAIFVYSMDRVLYANRATEELTGYCEEELLRLPLESIIVPEHRERARASRARRMAGDATPARFELQIERKNGERRWVLFTGALIDWHGQRAGLGTATDISERIRAEEALRRQVAFEQAVAEVTRRFLQLPVADLPAGVRYAFERLGPLIDVDRVQLFLVGEDRIARAAARWRRDVGLVAEEVPPIPVDGYPYAMSHWARGEALAVEDVELLPEAAAAERALGAAEGVRAAALVPLQRGERLLGFLAFENLRAPRAWSGEVLGLLGILAEVVTGAYARERAERELQQSRERLAMAQKAGRSVVWEWDVTSDRMHLPPLAADLFGVGVELVPRSGDELMRFIPPSDQEAIHAALRRTLQTGEPYLIEHRIFTDQGVRWLAVRGQLVADADRRLIVGVSSDVTEHRLAEEALLAEKERAQVTLASIGDGVVRTDADGRVDYMNPIAEQLTGWPAAKAIGRPLVEVYRVVDEASGQPRPSPVERCLAEGHVVVLPGHSLLLRRDGQEFAVRDSAAPVRDRNGKVEGAVLVFQDITQLRGLEQEMLYLARHDALTGLINRRELERQLEAAIASAAQGERRHALCYLDLDEFKLVNDTSGHIAGDELLRQLTSLLSSQVRDSDVLARLGGDEFGVLLRDCTVDNAVAVAEKLCKTVRQYRFTWEDRVFEVGVSIGVVPITRHAGSLSQVLSAADAACYVAKEHGRNRVHLYQPDDRAVAERYGEMQWVHRIQRGFDERRFRLYQQPIQPLRGDRPPMVELLLRLFGDDGQPLPTPSFIAAAERYHLIRTIDRWVVEEALRLLAERDDDKVYTLNLSGQSIGDPAFLDFLAKTVRASGLVPERLCFEITETASIANLGRAQQLIHALKDIGCRFVLDDFGSGLSSFAYLQSLPVDYLKIDGEFVRHMVEDPVQRALVQSIHQVGNLMGLATIAEHVEDEATCEALRAIGIDYAQGFWLGMPEPL